MCKKRLYIESLCKNFYSLREHLKVLISCFSDIQAMKTALETEKKRVVLTVSILYKINTSEDHKNKKEGNIAYIDHG